MIHVGNTARLRNFFRVKLRQQGMQKKLTIDDLALFGGKPLFAHVRPIGQLAVPDEARFFALAEKAFERRCLAGGPIAAELEDRLAHLHGVRHCIANANATLALIILIHVLAKGRRGEVIMPAFTYPGLPHIAKWAGQVPRFCDIDRETHALAPSAVEAAVGSKTTVILGVHQVNSPCFIDELTEISARTGVDLIFDSVHGAHCTYQGRPIGQFGRAEVFSLHATKLLNGFEGGYITTNDDSLADTLRAFRNFGFRSGAKAETLGMNSKLNEIHAALALSCLDHQGQVIARNKERYEAYQAAFEGLPGLSWVRYPDDGEQWNYEFALLDVGEGWPLTRDQTITLMRSENALARPYYDPPLHLSPHVPKGLETPSLPVTEELSKRFIQMPVGERLSFEDISRLGALFRFFRQNAVGIAKRMPTQGTI